MASIAEVSGATGSSYPYVCRVSLASYVWPGIPGADALPLIRENRDQPVRTHEHIPIGNLPPAVRRLGQSQRGMIRRNRLLLCYADRACKEYEKCKGVFDHRPSDVWSQYDITTNMS